MSSHALTVFIAGFVFGSVGLVAFVYGKRMTLWRPMLTGIALMVFPYFTSDIIVTCAIGVVLCASLFLLRE